MNKRTEAQHYLETKILGAYETAEVVWKNDTEGTYHRTWIGYTNLYRKYSDMIK